MTLILDGILISTSFSEALKGVESVFTPEEIALIQSGLNGDKLKVKSVSR